MIRKPITAAAVGTAFEFATGRVLQSMGFLNVERVGGRGDGGIDLRAVMRLPSSTPRESIASHVDPDISTNVINSGIKNTNINTIIQCKYVKHSGTGPRSLRELEGVIGRQPRGTLAVLATRFKLSNAALLAARSSAYPILLLAFEMDAADCDGGGSALSDVRGSDVSLFLNPAAQRTWKGLTTGAVYSATTSTAHARLCLLFNGRQLV
ncbi:hypothetical protein BJ741DRAFT_634510 [Chytriomyces cf. hyalinus JEL632]|nr:hypothetical protein BJ741DRAFT_634510 [Chytriomyces cf. hyalinus JEL632]